MKRNDVILLVLFVGCSPHFQSGKTLCSDNLECPDGFVCRNDGTNNLCLDSNTPGCASGGVYCEGLGICRVSLAACSGTTPGSGGTGGSTGSPPCPNASDYYCAASGTCWLNPVACSTVTNCGTSAAPDYRACSTAGYHPDCTGKCVPDTGGGAGGTGGGGGSCPSASDYYCAASGTCWLNPVACSTVTNCGTSAAPDYRACSTAGYHPDCTGKCVSDTSGSGGAGGTGAGGSTGCGAINPTCSTMATTTCGICLAECCCAQIVSCAANTSCSNLVSCESNCTTTSCDSACVALYPGGVTLMNSFLDCGVSLCPSACSSN